MKFAERHLDADDVEIPSLLFQFLQLHTHADAHCVHNICDGLTQNSHEETNKWYSKLQDEEQKKNWKKDWLDANAHTLMCDICKVSNLKSNFGICFTFRVCLCAVYGRWCDIRRMHRF